ncbi:MAG TPA: hypothetical protein VE988_21650 [Gemmataceae bacterium]|nr:hypothetical protein [Gemmataceae bacterium]
MRKLALALWLPVLTVLPALWVPAHAQEPIQPQVLYARQKQIAIPFDPDPAEAHRLKQLQLYYSGDQGKTWHLGATAAPDQRKFNFVAEGDGYYLFAVQTTDNNNRNYPEKMDGVTPGLRVVIDTTPPIVNVKALPPRGSEVGVTWEVRDENFDPTRQDSIQIEYRANGSLSWQPVFRTPGANQAFWAPGTSALIDVKIRARDLAGNTAEATTQVSLTGQGSFGTQGFTPGVAGGAPSEAVDNNRRFINTKRISLNYEITEKGPSGISGIDLWFTTDGRSWSKFQLPKADPNLGGPLTFEVQGEGLYGFTLVPKSGVGLSAPPPAIGEKPQLWIEVDLTKPVVQLESVMVGQGDYKGKLSISWKVSDKNLGPTPITLSYGAAKEGPWVPFASKIADTGSYIWTMPAGGLTPWQFHIKVEAVDRAGNVGEAVTPGLVKVDTLHPKAKIIDVQPGIR